jgi:hypothetical protein
MLLAGRNSSQPQIVLLFDYRARVIKRILDEKAADFGVGLYPFEQQQHQASTWYSVSRISRSISC